IRAKIRSITSWLTCSGSARWRIISAKGDQRRGSSAEVEGAWPAPPSRSCPGDDQEGALRSKAVTNPTATTSRAPTPVQRRGRLRAMDALRLLAALAVVLFHFTTRDHGRWGAQLPHEVFPALSHVVRYGYAGVHLFFTISGFVILMSVWGRSPRQFVASRISRLYPAFWVAVLATATLRWWWPA